MGIRTLLSMLINIPQNGEELQNPIHPRIPPKDHRVKSIFQKKKTTTTTNK